MTLLCHYVVFAQCFFFLFTKLHFFLQNIFVKTKHLKLSDWFLGSFFFKGTMYVSYYARGKVAPGIDTLNLLIQDIHIDITHGIFYCCMVYQTSNTKVENKQKIHTYMASTARALPSTEHSMITSEYQHELTCFYKQIKCKQGWRRGGGGQTKLFSTHTGRSMCKWRP